MRKRWKQVENRGWRNAACETRVVCCYGITHKTLQGYQMKLNKHLFYYLPVLNNRSELARTVLHELCHCEVGWTDGKETHTGAWYREVQRISRDFSLECGENKDVDEDRLDFTRLRFEMECDACHDTSLHSQRNRTCGKCEGSLSVKTDRLQTL